METSLESLTPSQSLPEPIPKKIMAIFGACKFASDSDKYKCPCEAGSSISSTSGVSMGTSCRVCGHLLVDHEGYIEEEQTSSDGFHPKCLPSQNCAFTLREQMVKGLAHLLDEYGVIHVRGTPSSGKTTLALLLNEHFINKGLRSLYFPCWPQQEMSATEFLALKCRKAGCTNFRERDLYSSSFNDLTFIIDEAQGTYNFNSGLWSELIKSRIGVNRGPRFCLFSSYGSPHTGTTSWPTYTTPALLSDGHKVSLICPPGRNGSGVFLFYTVPEFKDVVKRFCQEPGIGFILDDELQRYVFTLTNGHPGMVRAILVFVERVYRNNFKNSETRKLTLSKMSNYFDDDKQLFDHLTGSVAGRGLPSRKMMNHSLRPGVINVLLSILRDGSIRMDMNNDDMVYCFKSGFIHTVEGLDGNVTCILPSTLHSRFVEYYYGSSPVKDFPRNAYPNISSLCLKVLRAFSKEMLLKTKNSQRLGPSGRLQPPEDFFQIEFYRCFWNETDSAVGISSEWSGTSGGRIDFLVPSACWGFELLRDGDRIEEHCSRFEPGGAYHPWIQDGRIKDWLILDCRHSMPRKTYPSQNKLWRVVFMNDYSRVKILDSENHEMEEFALANR